MKIFDDYSAPGITFAQSVVDNSREALGFAHTHTAAFSQYKAGWGEGDMQRGHLDTKSHSSMIFQPASHPPPP